MGMGVHQAMRFKHDNLDAAIRQVWALKDKAHMAQVAYLASQFAKVAEQVLVKRYRFGHEVKHSPLSQGWNSWREAKRGPEIDYRGREWDTMFDLALYEIKCPESHDTIILGKSLTGQTTFHNLLMRNLPVVKYDYWDNTDPPSNQSAATWRLRRRHWEEALPGVGVPRDNGLVISLGKSEPECPSAQAVLRRLKLEDIIERQSKKLIISDYTAALSAANPLRGGSFSISRYLAFQERAREYLNTAEGAKARWEEMQRLAAALPNPLMREHL